MKRELDIHALLEKSKEMIGLLEEKYKKITNPSEITLSIKVEILQFLNTLRPVLDYLAADIAELVRRKELDRTPYFPCRISTKHFEKDIKKKIPSLKEYFPDIYDYLLSKQPFISINNNWWTTFNNITNKNKHNSLSNQILLKQNQMSVGNGNLVIRGGYIKVSKGAIINGEKVEEDFEINANDTKEFESNKYFGSIVRSPYYNVIFRR